MIRTAILAGILLVMLSMAYSRQGAMLPVQPAALLKQPQVKAVTHPAKAIAKQVVNEEPAEPAPVKPAIVAAQAPPICDLLLGDRIGHAPSLRTIVRILYVRSFV